MSEVEPKPLFKKRANRPPPRQREPEEAADEVKADEAREGSEGADEDKMTLEELLELRKLRRQRQGIDSTKLVEGASKRRRKKADDEEDEEEKYGLQKSSQRKEVEEEDSDDDPDGVDAVAKKIIKSNNFTQQTNKLDVDKHMMSYIEQELEKRRGKPGSSNATTGSSSDPYAELFRISEKYKIEKKELEEGSVTNSSAMLTAIPEVDLGMDTRLKNIEDTEKAKRTVSETRKETRRPRDGNDERHLTATRFFNPHLKVQSDADAMRDAKLEAMGLPPEMDTRGYIKERDSRRDVATDEQVMERFKKRMRK